MRKRFVKLLLFKVDTQYRLLYGFSSETEESSYPWKAFPADRKGQKLIAKAILSPSEADNFLISLTGTEPIMLCERVTLKSPQLYKREQLLYSDDEEQQTVPISEFCYLSEFWNREKLSLLSEIQNEFNADGRKLYEQTLELLEWAKCNCGIDFCIDGRRFGNYEVYYRTPENSSFEIDIHKDQGLRVTTIRKCKDFAEDIIVNCIGKYKDYMICNQTQVWPANKKEIYFEANEPMTSVVVHAWNAATGKLIFTKIYVQYRPLMERTATRILKEPSDIEDAVQNAFVQIIRHFDKIYEIPREELPFWIISIVKNEALLIIRKSQKTVSLENWDGYVIESENVLDYTELVNLFTKLPLSYRAVLEMKILHGYSDKEIATHLGISETAVSTRASRGRTLLREIVRKEGFSI